MATNMIEVCLMSIRFICHSWGSSSVALEYGSDLLAIDLLDREVDSEEGGNEGDYEHDE